MLILAAFLLVDGQVNVALIPAFCCISTWVLSLILWQKRKQLSAYAGLMILLGWLVLAIPAAWFSTELLAGPNVLARMNWPDSIFVRVIIALMAPALMLHFTLSDKR